MRLASDDDGSVRATRRRERRRPRYAPYVPPPANSTGRADISVRSLRIGVTLFRSKLAVTIEAMTLLSAGTVAEDALVTTRDDFAAANVGTLAVAKTFQNLERN